MVRTDLQRKILRELRRSYPDHLNPASSKFRQEPDYDASLWDLANKGLIAGVSVTRAQSGKASYTEGNLTLTPKGWDHSNRRKEWLRDHAHQFAIAAIASACGTAAAALMVFFMTCEC